MLANIKTTGTITVINRLLKPGVYIVTLNVGGKNITKKVML